MPARMPADARSHRPLTFHPPAHAPSACAVARVWASSLKLPITSFHPASNFFEFGGSLALVSLARGIADAIGVSVPVPTLLQAPTLGAMAAACARAANAAGAADGGLPLDADGFDPAAVALEYPLSVPPLEPPTTAAEAGASVLARAQGRSAALGRGGRTVLVTGATGYVGAFVMRHLALDENVSTVHCLVRAKTADAARERLRATCVSRGIDASAGFATWFDTKIVAWAADVAVGRFGIGDGAYAALAAQVDAVVHVAAEVNMIKPPSVLAPANVGGTANVCAFCADARVPFVFTSTMQPLDGATPSGYRQSKEAAEHVCANAFASHGVPSAVLQLGDIAMPPAGWATLPDDDYIVVLSRACLALGLVPEAAWSVAIMPVDQCASLLCTLALTTPTADFDAVARETKGDLVPWGMLCDWLRLSAPTLATCSLVEWKRAVDHAAQASHPTLEKAAFARLLFLLPAIEQEFEAEDRRRRAGEGATGKLFVDAAWGRVFADALAAETANRGGA